MSDSKYVVDCFIDGWWEGWLRPGWRNSAKKPVLNRDLWEPLIDLARARKNITFEWVKAHNGDAWNERADELAVEAARRQSGRNS
jgi:ribonuclease HI